MNPIFIFIVLIAAGLVWFIGSFMFPIIGKACLKLWEELKINLDEEENNENEEG